MPGIIEQSVFLARLHVPSSFCNSGLELQRLLLPLIRTVVNARAVEVTRVVMVKYPSFLSCGRQGGMFCSEWEETDGQKARSETVVCYICFSSSIENAEYMTLSQDISSGKVNLWQVCRSYAVPTVSAQTICTRRVQITKKYCRIERKRSVLSITNYNA